MWHIDVGRVIVVDAPHQNDRMTGAAAHAGDGGDGRLILTPDQRVRVFVSSTMEELAAERTAVRTAIEGLHLSPILFELGARAHPPQSLYRSYLDQSHVFLGIYWQRYGWVAPGMDVSGLEDEYLLAGAKPKLVYVKRPATEREDGLTDLLDRIREADDVSYKSFSSAEELERLVTDDLALLLSEAFLVDANAPSARQHRLTLSPDVTTFVGRAAELQQLCALLERDDVRLVTLTGPGGIGKTRLALRAAAEVAARFDEGAAFVPLASISDASLVPSAIANAVGLRDISRESTLDALKGDLADRSLLLVVDNFEHLVAAAELLPELLGAAPGIKLLVTSREALRVQAEHDFLVPPLAPAEGVSLFDQRAGAVRHGFHVDDANAATIAAICDRLENLPLAIELAAARARLLPPDTLLERLDNRLDFLVGGARDLPERQRALRATIQWSHDMLDDEERDVFACLAAFAGGFSLDAAETVCGDGGDVLELLASLVDKSLLRAEAAAHEPRFRMLEMIREFARERLEEKDEAELVLESHAAFYRKLSVDVGAGIRGREQARWLRLLSPDGDGEADNVRAALAWFLRHGRLDEWADMAWSLWIPAWITGRIEEGRRLARDALAAEGELTERSRARLLVVAGLFDMWKGDHDAATAALKEGLEVGRALHDDEVVSYGTLAWSMVAAPDEGESRAESLAQESLDVCRQRGDRWGEAAALNVLGWLYVSQERFEGTGSLFDETLSSAQAVGDEQFAALAEVNLAEYLLHHGDVDAAARLLAASADRHRAVRSRYSVAYLLDAAARVALHHGDPNRASVLLGSASHARETISVSVWGSQLGRRDRLVAQLQTAIGRQAFDDAFASGAALGYSEALDAVASPA